MPKPSLLVNGVAVTTISVTADGINFVPATISTSPPKPGFAFSLDMNGLIPADKVAGTLDSNGQAFITFGPTRMRGAVSGRVKVPTLTSLDFEVKAT